MSVNKPGSQAGFTLVELLVSVVIMAIGILGVAALQVVSLQQNRSALFRAEALQISNDILDRMRANPTVDYAPVAIGEAPAANKNCMDPLQNCARNEMKEFDVAQWICSVNSENSSGVTHANCLTYGITGALPEGGTSIVAAGDVYTIRVEWVDDRKGTVAFINLVTQIN
jgi:type IV pilus assembly protein PilV